jgi:hypothetical protein
MDLKTLLGDDYKDGMTIEEINAALADKNFVDSSTLPKSVSKEVFDKTASELATVKKELRKLKESSMTAEEKVQEELNKAQELQKTYAKELAKLKAKEIFVEAGLIEKDYASLLDAVVSEDEEVTISRAKAMVDVINAQKQAVEQAVKAELLKGTPKPPAGGGGSIGKVDYEKEIAEARERGDMVTMAALIRQQQMVENQNK